MSTKRKICVVTGTRAEYGLLYYVMKKIEDDLSLDLQIIVTGMHLSSEFGLTYRTIESDGFKISKKIEILLSSDSDVAIGKSVGLGMIGFTDAFSQLMPDIVLVLGDRFEIFAAVSSAMICRIPIAHCHGGEATEGLIDEAIRHSITKMSHLHFVSTEIYKKRVIQLGEMPNLVFNVGALGIESINKINYISKEKLSKELELDLEKKFFLITFHPVTLENSSAESQINNILSALDGFNNYNFVFTKANADNDGRIINELLENYVKNNKERAVLVASLGQVKYLSCLKYTEVVIGNSSSGIIEAPSLKTPTVNIGDRQNGRIKAKSIIDCQPNKLEIISAINKAISFNDNNQLANMQNPYGNANSSDKIVEVLKAIDLKGILKKKFYDIK